MFKKIYWQIISHFPSKNGQKTADELAAVLNNGGIQFEISKHDDESGKYFVAKSVNLEQGYIITSGKNLIELDKNIKDAIFTAFEVPAYYCDRIQITNANESIRELKYAAAI